MLLGFVLLYLAATIGIGVYASKRVHGAKDFLVAGRSLPLYINLATVFATWFGAETVLSVSATFAKDGLHGLPADPFGASFALVFVALFFAKAFYRMDLLTIGDFYHKRYGKLIEVVTKELDRELRAHPRDHLVDALRDRLVHHDLHAGQVGQALADIVLDL